MRREREHGRVGHIRMRFYHAMFQLFIFAMLLCLLTNNVGVVVDCDGASHAFHRSARLSISHSESH